MVASSQEPSPAPSGMELHDVVVVGGGLAGLTAAKSLAGYDVLVLEAEDRLGGRVRSDDRDPYWLNFGAHVFGGRTSPVGGLIDACGVETCSVDGSFTAMAFPGRLIDGGGPTAILRRAPLPFGSRLALATSGLKVMHHSRRYRGFVRSLRQHIPAEVNKALLGFMADRTFAELLGPLPRELDQIYRAISNRAQAEPEELSAGAAMSAFALVFGKDRSLGRNVVGGAGRLVDALTRQLSCAVRTRSRVTGIVPGRDGVVVEHVGETSRVIHAKHVIVATPPHVAANLVSDLPQETSEALRDIRFGPSIVMTMLTRERRPMPWDGIYSAVVPGKSFNMFFNQANVLRSRESHRRPGGSLMIYASGDLGRRLMGHDDQALRDLFLRDLYDVFPELVGLVDEVAIKRWEFATSYSHSGRAALQPALERDLGRVTLAGDYLGAWFTDSAVLTGADAAARVRRLLAGSSSPSEADGTRNVQC